MRMSRSSVPIHWIVGEPDLVDLGRRERFGDQARIERGDDGAVLGRVGVEIAHRRHAGRARHVLHDDVRIARDVAAEMARQQARILVVAAAGRIADHERDRLAFVEALLRERTVSRHASIRPRERGQHRANRRGGRSCSLFPLSFCSRFYGMRPASGQTRAVSLTSTLARQAGVAADCGPQGLCMDAARKPLATITPLRGQRSRLRSSAGCIDGQ